MTSDVRYVEIPPFSNVPVPVEAVAVRINGVRVTLPPADGLIPDFDDELVLIAQLMRGWSRPQDYVPAVLDKTMPGTERLTLQTSNAQHAQHDTHAKGADARAGRSLSHEENR